MPWVRSSLPTIMLLITTAILNMFATLFFGIIDPKTGLLTYVNGGHEPLVIIGEDGIKSRLMPTGSSGGHVATSKVSDSTN
jgi:sigma-B regulation protein RsbU (phosphoserine phosphatase)